MKSYYFLRHGESQGNYERVIQGQADLPLTDKGRNQAQCLADYWSSNNSNFDLTISSPLMRAFETAKIISTRLNVTIQLDPDLMERSFGILEGINGDQVLAQFPKIDYFHPYNFPFDGAETVIDLYIRACKVLKNLVDLPDGKYLIVSHGAFLNMVAYAILGITPQGHRGSPLFLFGNTSFMEWKYDPEISRWYFISFGNPCQVLSPE